MITAVNDQTLIKSDVSAGPQGEFVFPSLQPGFYTVTVEAKGFRKGILKNVELGVAATFSQTISLEVGQTVDSVVVEANTANVQMTESSLSSAITMRNIDTLPQLARTPITLAIFQPGVQIDIRAGQDASFSRINGLRQGSNNSKLDGIDVNDSLVPRLGLSLTANNSDSVEEFRVTTQGGKAEYGRSAGGQIELLTRSGTNSYHGAAYDYLRNTDLNANDFFNNQSGNAVPQLIRNIYGGSFGGPILHNKTFIFGNFQGTRTHQQAIQVRTVPTLNARNGLFTYKDSTGALKTYNIAANDPRGIGIDPAVAKILALYPAPNNTDVGDGLNTAGFRFNNSTPALEDQFTIRGDHHLTKDITLFLRWSWQRNSSVDNLNGADATFPGQINGTQGGHRWGFSTGMDWTISPTVFNEFRIGHQSATVSFNRPNRPSGPTPVWAPFLTDVGFTGFGQGRNSPVNDITENITKVWNNHTFKAGANLRFTTQYGFNFNGVYPNVTMNVANGNNVLAAAGPTGLSSTDRTNFESLYNILLGRIDSVTTTFYSDLSNYQAAGTPRVRNFNLHEYGYFFQDDWRITRRLTLNLGLRYEFFGVPTERDNFIGNLDQAAAISSSYQSVNTTVKRGGKWYENDWNNFAPRFGFAYDLTGDGKTAIRGNFGIFYDRNAGAVVNGADGNTPGFSQAVPIFPNQNGGDVRFSDNYPLPQAPSAPVLTLPTTRSNSIILFNPKLRTGYVESYSLNVQRQLTPGTLIQVAYVGNRGVKLYYNEDINQPQIYTNGFVNDFKQIQAFIGSGASVPATNVFSKLFSSPQAAVTALGASNFTQGRVGTVVNSLDRNATNYNKFAAAGLPSTYFRNLPQYNQVVLGTNDGRSYYNSLQVSVRRTAGSLQMTANYTWSKSMDNVSAEGNGFTTPIDSNNLRLNRALSDFDRPHSLNMTGLYALPFGQGKIVGNNWPKLVNTVLGGWQLGGLMILQSGQPFSVSSQRATTAVSGVANTYANYSGTDRSIGGIEKRVNGVFFFPPDQVAQFTPPAAGEIGNSGRNVFRNPVFFEIDNSLVKKFAITEKANVSFRAEAYNILNHPNFGLAAGNLNINNPASFGKFSATLGTQVGASSARTMQLALRFDF